MKNLFDNSQPCETAVKHELCSEKTCATCFEHRGCMYDHHLFAAILNMEASQLESRMCNATQGHEHRYNIRGAAVAA